MLPKPGIRMARLHRTTQQDIWGRSSWVRPQVRFLPTEAAIGGRHIVTVAITILILRRTVALIGAMVIIRTRRLTMTTIRELTAGKRVRTAPTDQRPPEPATILTRARTREAVRSRHRMAAEPQ